MGETSDTWRIEGAGTARRPLTGIRILDLCVAGPGPFCTLVLAAHGASVIHVARPGAVDPMIDTTHQNAGKRSIVLDLKTDDGREVIRRLAREADVVLEGFRPGVVERLGIGPEVLTRDNERLVYVRMTGWGQDGPYAGLPGHDINYLAISGALSVIGRDEPTPPLALLGDFSAGGLTAAVSILAALRERDATGKGGVIDANIVDGAAMLLYSTVAAAPRGRDITMVELLNGTAPFYRAYRCADGKWFSVGAIEPKFYRVLLEQLGLSDDPFASRQYDKSAWPETTARFAAAFATRTRDDWTPRMTGCESCAFPVVELGELADDPHLAARGTAIRVDGLMRTTRAGRKVGEPATPFGASSASGASTADVLASLGYAPDRIARMSAGGTVDRE